MRLLFLFLDGVGLGPPDPAVNPLVTAAMPTVTSLLGGRRLVAHPGRVETERATLLALDACLGVSGLPQSASGQATLLTGINVPAAIGRHYGPKPDPEIQNILRKDNLFCTLRAHGQAATLLNAYPEGYYQAIDSGRRIYSAIPQAVTNAGIALRTAEDLSRGQALSADFTGQGWRDHLGYHDTPVLSPEKAGERLAKLAEQCDLAFFEFWLSDLIGHRQDRPGALALLSTLDRVLAGLLAAWDDGEGVILLTSDHGNLEDLTTRRHTTNPVPALAVGARDLRNRLMAGWQDLTDVTPGILSFLGAIPESRPKGKCSAANPL